MPDTTPTLRDRIAAVLWPLTNWDGDECNAVAAADMVLAVLPELPARLVLGTTDQQPTTEQSAPINWQAIVQQRERELKTALEARYTAEPHRLALSEALGLGTGAPWDAIRDRAAELSAAPVDRAAVLNEAADRYDGDRMVSRFFGHQVAADLRRMADEAQPTADQPTQAQATCCCGEPDDATVVHRTNGPCYVDQPDEAAPLCGKTVGRSGIYYRPCARPAGHPEAYCRDDTGDHLFLAAADQPDTETEADTVVAYRNANLPGILLCREHGWDGLTPLTSEDLPDGGICTWVLCDRDVLATPDTETEAAK
ncbi:hypothetical protein [Streptomyces sp. NPDC047939]|uniref:hypothetical protein n=1 Tax=Streptomyces sp. NPDC047939 TaxID=3155381 RepID=UPI0034203700